jgi:hypothetical protein
VSVEQEAPGRAWEDAPSPPEPPPETPPDKLMQAEYDVLPNGDVIPLGHDVHVDAPLVLHDPAAQAIGFREFKGQYEPAGQMTGVPDMQK